MEKPKPQPAGKIADVDGLLVDTGNSSKKLNGSSQHCMIHSEFEFNVLEVSGIFCSSATSATGEANPLNQVLLPAPETNVSAISTKLDPKMDLLSGDDFSSPKADNSLALVPVGGQQPTTPVSQQNALVLFDMFSDGKNAPNSVNTQPTNLPGQINPSTPPQAQRPQNFQSLQNGFYSNGSVQNMGAPQHEQSIYTQGTATAWNDQIIQQQQLQLQQPPSPGYGVQSSGSFPPPPWEAYSADEGSPVANAQHPHSFQLTQVVVTHGFGGSHPQGLQSMGHDQVVGMYIQPITSSHLSAINSQVAPSSQSGMYPQPFHGRQHMGMLQQQPMQVGPVAPMYPHQMYGNQMASYGYGQQQGAQYVEQSMCGLSVEDDNAATNSYQVSPSSYLPPMKPSKPEDKLFGDLVDLAKFKPTKPIM